MGWGLSMFQRYYLVAATSVIEEGASKSMLKMGC